MPHTIQVKQFYAMAKKVGLKRGDFSATSPKDKHGEYQDLRVVLYCNLTEKQTRQIAEHYRVLVYRRNGKTNWGHPSIYNERGGLELWDLDKQDENGLYEVTKL